MLVSLEDIANATTWRRQEPGPKQTSPSSSRQCIEGPKCGDLCYGFLFLFGHFREALSPPNTLTRLPGHFSTSDRQLELVL